jgi:hypothetical protein
MGVRVADRKCHGRRARLAHGHGPDASPPGVPDSSGKYKPNRDTGCQRFQPVQGAFELQSARAGGPCHHINAPPPILKVKRWIRSSLNPPLV